MGTLIENLNEIYSIKGDIRSAIEDKGVDMTGMSFPDYPTAIGQISGGGTFVTETLNVSVNNTYYPGQGVDGFSMVVVDVPQSVTGFTEKEVTEGVQITDLNNSAGYVHSFVFEKDTYLQTVNLPNCSIVNEQAFAYCTNLTTVSLPTCQTLGFSAFNACSNLINVYLPVCSAMSENAFNGCNKLQTIVCPELTSGSNVVFAYCSSLVSIDLPKLTKVGRSMFMNSSGTCLLYQKKIYKVNLIQKKQHCSFVLQA